MPTLQENYEQIKLDRLTKDTAVVTRNVGGGDASSSNQTDVQAIAGSDATKAVSVQGISGGKAIPVTQAFASTSTLSNVVSSATSVTLLAANNNRKTAVIVNDSTSDLYVTLNASAASTTNYSLFLAAKAAHNVSSSLILKGSDYSGEIRGIWSTANGFARVTEIV